MPFAAVMKTLVEGFESANRRLAEMDERVVALEAAKAAENAVDSESFANL